MSGFFGCVSKRDCVADVFYGTDYHSHLGTKRGGMAFYDGKDFVRTIHSLENAYFRNKFEDDLPRFEGSRQGIGIISDMESQPITLTSHLGRFSLVAIGRIDNLEELTRELLGRRLNFAELSASRINPTELGRYARIAGRLLSRGNRVGAEQGERVVLDADPDAGGHLCFARQVRPHAGGCRPGRRRLCDSHGELGFR